LRDLNECMNSFRVASRELFNHYFRGDWDDEERFQVVQAALFEQMVLVPSSTEYIRYGNLNPNIRALLNANAAPIMINREIDCGYWDHPRTEITRDATLLFITFFDWDQLAVRDNKYVRVQVKECPEIPEIIGKHALIDCQYIMFERII
jgi:hypothetical protein